MKNRYVFTVLSVLLVPVGKCFAAEAQRDLSVFDDLNRAPLDEQMRVLHQELTVVKEKIKEIERKEEAAIYQVSTGKGNLSVEDIQAVQLWGADALVALEVREKRIKNRIAFVAGQIKSLKEAAIALSRASEVAVARVVSPQRSALAQGRERSVSQGDTEKIEHTKECALNKQRWIQETRQMFTEKLDELRTIQNRYDANAGMLPEATLLILRDLQKQQPNLVRGLKDLDEHQDGLERFLAGIGLAGFLDQSGFERRAQRSGSVGASAADDRHVTFGTHYVTDILPNDAAEGDQEPDLAAARRVVVAQAVGVSTGGRRNAALPRELPVIEGDTMRLPLTAGVVALSERESVPSARSEALRARRGTGFVPESNIKRTDAFLSSKK